MKVSQRFLHDTRSVPKARHFVTRFLAGSAPETRNMAEMMVSELTTNCLLHTESDFTVSLEQTEGQLRVEVSDEGEGRPVLRSTDPTSLSGRGLRTIDMLSETWGIKAHPDTKGKTVWFTLSLPAIAQEA